MMAKFTAGATIGTHKREPLTIDVMRHTDGLREAAAQVRELVTRMANGKALLNAMPQDDDDRPEGERLWADLMIRLYLSLRSAYGRWALLKIALPYEEALALWDGEMPDREAMRVIGIDDLMNYWRCRTDRPEWMTDEEGRLMTKHLWPSRYGEDAIEGGLRDAYEEPPFD